MMQYKSIIYLVLFFSGLIIASCTPGVGTYSSTKKPKESVREVSINVIPDTLQYVLMEGVFVESDLDSKAQPLVGEKEFTQSMLRSIRYPKIARENGVEGTCLIGVVINRKGEMESAEILKSIGAGCGKEALRVVEQAGKFGFYPAFKNGMPIKVRFNIPVTFRLG